MTDFMQYGHALVSIAGFAILTLLLAPFAARQKAKEGVVSGAGPAPDYANRTYRLWRAHMNATENIGIFAGVTFAAILAGASPLWVNWLASIFLLARLLHAVVHIAGIGKADFGPRTFIFVAGWACNLALAILTIVAVFA